MTTDAEPQRRAHILQELGFGVRPVGDELHGSAAIVPEMHVPGTAILRTSLLATWADTVAGRLAVDHLAPGVPVTLELDVHVYEQVPHLASISAIGRILKAGRSVVVATVDFVSDRGEPVAVGAGSFMAAPDPRLTMPPISAGLPAAPPGQRLRVPLAERAGCERRAPGVAVLPRSDDGLNSSNTVNGGLIALLVEEAVLSITPRATLSSLSMRYLRPVRVGPAVASATVLAGVGRVEVRDAGSDDRLAVVATTRTSHLPPRDPDAVSGS